MLSKTQTKTARSSQILRAARAVVAAATPKRRLRARSNKPARRLTNWHPQAGPFPTD